MPSTPAGGTTRTPEATRTEVWTAWPTSASASSAPAPPRYRSFPHVAASAGELFVFQRTPSSIDVRANRPTDPSWAASLEPGWQRERMENFTLLTSGGFAEAGPRHGRLDRHHRKAGHPAARPIVRSRPGSGQPSGAGGLREDGADPVAGGRHRRRTRRPPRPSSPGTASSASVLASTTSTCRRSTAPTSRWSTPTGAAWTPSRPRASSSANRTTQLDCLIYATGFEVGTDYTRRAGYDVIGARGDSLSEYWRDGMRSVHGMHVHGFPEHVRPRPHPRRLHGQLPPPPRGGERAPLPRPALCHRP